jgi:pyroglutamyl-peptidase
MRNERPIVLLTGFGPFPGHPSNVSGLLAERLACIAACDFPGYRIRSATLPTEWQAGPRLLAQLIGELQPQIAIHLGISRRARGFMIETRARNVAALTCDAIGELPAETRLSGDGADVLASTWPAGRIVERLRRRGLPATLSHDAGRYLCNAILYHSLATLPSAPNAVLPCRGFVHIPPSLGETGHSGRTSPSQHKLGWAEAIEGGLEILAACLGRSRSRRRS